MINREHFVDCSDNEQFSFSLTCASCGYVYKSTPVAYLSDNKGKHALLSEISLHQDEYSKAFSIASTEAEKAFKTCYLCENTICNRCAISVGDKFVCNHCQKELVAEVYNNSSSDDKFNCIMFNRFVVPVFQNLNYHLDGERGKRVAFVEDDCKRFLISFEENMPCMDLVPATVHSDGNTTNEYRNGNRYIHQRKVLTNKGKGNNGFIFFHMEFTDENGIQVILPGQMNLSNGDSCTDDVEPILKDFLNNIELC